MSPLFKFLGIAVALYTIYAAVKGEVYARSGVRVRIVSRRDSPAYFWTVVAIYAGLSVALVTVS